MNGRLENEIKIHLRTEEKLKVMPEFVHSWYSNLKASRKTAATCYDYVSKIQKFLKYINEDVASICLEDITEEAVTNYFTSIQTKETNSGVVFTSDSYQCTVWSCLDNFLEYLADHGKIEINYMKYISKPKNRDIDRINENRSLLTTEDFKSILDCVEKESNPIKRNRNMAILMLFMSTGMRKTALINIMNDDIDFNNATLSIIDKGNKRHTYVLNDETLNAIEEWLDVRCKYARESDDGHLFISNRGSMMGDRTVVDLVEKYTKAALGKPLSPHKLRAGYCSILYDKTHDAEFVRRAVGHANVATTQRYIVTKGNERKKAAEIMASIL